MQQAMVKLLVVAVLALLCCASASGFPADPCVRSDIYAGNDGGTSPLKIVKDFGSSVTGCSEKEGAYVSAISDFAACVKFCLVEEADACFLRTRTGDGGIMDCIGFEDGDGECNESALEEYTGNFMKAMWFWRVCDPPVNDPPVNDPPVNENPPPASAPAPAPPPGEEEGNSASAPSGEEEP